MKSIFIAGPRAIKKLDNKVLIKLKQLEDNNYTIYVGDANGVDKLIQDFYNNLNYQNVNVFASNGKARNNMGNWKVNSVDVDKSIRGFEFYAQKDKAMAKSADMGFMIWNGKSKGTLNNMINLREENKRIILFFTPLKQFFEIVTEYDLLNVIETCHEDTGRLYEELKNKNSLKKKVRKIEQISMII